MCTKMVGFSKIKVLGVFLLQHSPPPPLVRKTGDLPPRCLKREEIRMA